VIYESTVAAGPFRIQDLNAATTGKLDVQVQEQDGSVKKFSINTSDIPYLTRPGTVRYKLATGKTAGYLQHSTNGPAFGSGEFSWGVNNGWSVYGGALIADDYSSTAAGVGRDLLALGALSFDLTQSNAHLPDRDAQGRSWRLSYSKRFDTTDSQITFAGYRFSTRDYMTMSQFMDARHEIHNASAGSKQSWTMTFSQQFPDLNTSAYLSYTYNTFWDHRTNDTYSLSLARYMDMGSVKNINLSMSAMRSEMNNKQDDSLYLGVSVPWGNQGSLSYNTGINGKKISNNVGYYDRLNDSTTYHISGGRDQYGNASGSGYLTYEGSATEMAVTAARQGQVSSLGMSLRGGMTATVYGAALHRTGTSGGTRMMLDTSGMGGVPVRANGGDAWTNRFGKAVVSDVGSYWRSSERIDLDKLADDVEPLNSVVEDTLTEGAIGYRKFTVIAGKKAMAILKLSDGTTPPFGAEVQNEKYSQTGIINDDGSVWLSGIQPGEMMAVSWDGKVQCHITLPSPLPAALEEHTLLLPCLSAGQRPNVSVQK